eukprot:764240-Hanusia_phi.AAC.1
MSPSREPPGHGHRRGTVRYRHGTVRRLTTDPTRPAAPAGARGRRSRRPKAMMSVKHCTVRYQSVPGATGYYGKQMPSLEASVKAAALA